MGHDTDITVGKKDKRYSRHLGTATITGIILAAVTYHLQDYITPVIDSYDICQSDRILEVSSWLFPRINAHCNELIYTSAGNHESAGVAIIIDLYSGLFFLYMLSFNFSILVHTTTDEYSEIMKRRWYKTSSKSHSTLMIIFPFALVLLFFISEDFYFGHPLIPEEDANYLSRSISILHSSTGFGAVTQIFQASAVSVIPECVYGFWALVKEDMAKDRGAS